MRLLFTGMMAMLLFGGARAAVQAACVFGDHMVLQRECAVPVWGTAAPGEAVTVAFAGQTARTTAGPDGAWRVRLQAMKPSAEPRELTIAGAANTLTFTDVLVGEVWLCGGQSNMDWPVRLSNDGAAEAATARYPAIRAFTARYAAGQDGDYRIAPKEHRFALAPQTRCLGSWDVCTPDTAKNWSGVGYFFARDLHARLGVPVGILVAAYGASAIEAWTSLPGLKAVPRYRARAAAYEEAVQAYLTDPNGYPQALEAMTARVAAREQAWFAQLDAEDPGITGRWMAPGLATEQWEAVALPVSVADNPIGAPVASIWFRREVTIPPAWVGQELELHLGVVDAVDDSYVNGIRVGRTWFDTREYWSISRVYPVPASAVTSTTVTLSVRLLKLIYHMGLFGPAAEMKLVRKGAPEGEAVWLAGAWRMRKAQDLDAGAQPQLPPIGTAAPGSAYGHPAVMYHGLIHPLIPYAIRGAIWYQGEANAPFYTDYRELLPGLITSWRKEWGQGEFPFGIVQLASYHAQQTAPVDRGGYINLREAQAMALRVPGTFLATAMDIGEGDNIHPKNKQEVGRRLALGALATAYGHKGLFFGPVYRSMKREGQRIRLRFDYADGLHAKGDPPVGFAIAGADRAFYFARATIEGEEVVVWSDKVPAPVAVRYAWATNPVCNLYNRENLPIYPFHTDNWDLSQLVIPRDTITLPTGWVAR